MIEEKVPEKPKIEQKTEEPFRPSSPEFIDRLMREKRIEMTMTGEIQGTKKEFIKIFNEMCYSRERMASVVRSDKHNGLQYCKCSRQI